MKNLLSACLALLAVVACAESSSTARFPAPGTAHEGPIESRVEAHGKILARITNALCDREQSCGTIGPGGYFPNRDECSRTVFEKYRLHLSAAECPDGIDQAELDKCLTSIESTQCSGTADAITRSARCPTDALCLK